MSLQFAINIFAALLMGTVIGLVRPVAVFTGASALATDAKLTDMTAAAPTAAAILRRTAMQSDPFKLGGDFLRGPQARETGSAPATANPASAAGLHQTCNLCTAAGGRARLTSSFVEVLHCPA
jgi:hypothetical protein